MLKKLISMSILLLAIHLPLLLYILKQTNTHASSNQRDFSLGLKPNSGVYGMVFWGAESISGIRMDLGPLKVKLS